MRREIAEGRTIMWFGEQKLHLRPVDAGQEEWFTETSSPLLAATTCASPPRKTSMPSRPTWRPAASRSSVAPGAARRRAGHDDLGLDCRDPDGSLIEIVDLPLRRAQACSGRSAGYRPRKRSRASAYGSIHSGRGSIVRVTFTQADTACARVVPYAGGHAAEQRGAVGGALVDHGRLERASRAPTRRSRSHSSRARAAARDAPHARAPAELLDEVERVAQAEGHALEHRPRQGAAVVAQAEAREGAARPRVGVRRALAGQVGREEQPLDPRLPFGRAARGARRRCPRPSRAATAATRPR